MMKKLLIVLTATLSVVAFAEAQQTGAPSSSAIAKLEKTSKTRPGNASALRALGIAYYKAARFEEARTTLTTAQKLAPKDGVTTLYLGLSAEETGDLKAAREAYSKYLSYGRTQRVRNQLKARLVAITRKEMKAYAQQAVAQEANFVSKLAGAGQPTTIAVLPLRFNGTDANLAPLSRGIADLMITDLSRSKKLTVLERDKVQALVDEINLSQGGSVDATTALRTGKLMRAGQVIQGSINQLPEESIQLGAAVVDVSSTEIKSTAESTDKLDRIFTMQKQLVFNVFDALGVRLTPAERQLVDRRPTRSLAAFLAYSSGLLEEDRGNMDAAQRFYNNAIKLDPSFSTAIQRNQQVQSITVGTTVTQSVETSLQGTTEGTVATAAGQGTVTTVAAPGTSETLASATAAINPSPASDLTNTTTTASAPATAPPAKDPASAATGTENPVANGKIVVIIRQPGT